MVTIVLKEKRERQKKMDILILEHVIPKDHLLIRIGLTVAFSFIHDFMQPLYC